MQKVIVIGAGIIGAVSAYYLQSSGAQVTVVDAGKNNATAASFGWMNASFFVNEDHFHLRNEGLEAYRRLAKKLDIPVNWSGCLCWENEGDAFERQFQSLRALDYPVESIDAASFRELEPLVTTPPEKCLLLRSEASLESHETASRLLEAAVDMGARLLTGIEVEGFIEQNDCIVGTDTTVGPITAEKVLIAAGTGSATLSAKLDLNIPMLDRPALILKTKPVKQKLRHILVSEIGEVRQLPDGSLLMPTTVGHQGDKANRIEEPLEKTADLALGRLRKLLPSLSLELAEVTLAFRPFPSDDLPVVGALKPGSYIATMHSGITLAAIMGELISTEILHGPSNETSKWLAPYRPQRFNL
ncbi:MAG: FAD-dependent oxidoreductase [Pseudomonadota bacterium]